MKLLLDQNLSPKLLRKIYWAFPEAEHVRNLGMKQSSDTVIWQYAAANRFTIVSKDADFHQRSFVHGAPPKVIGILGCNCPTEAIAELLTLNASLIESFCNDAEAAFLPLVVK